MAVSIFSRYDTTKPLYTVDDAKSIGEAVISLVKSGANLSGADLSRANLSGANLSGADLSRANLYGAELYGANLSGAELYGAELYGANLSGAELYGAELYGANLSGANLSGAELYGANLSGANLSGANLSGANLSGANLSGANLSRANLSGANLSGANLSGADLSRANLSGANLSGADLSGAENLGTHDSHKLAIARTRITPAGRLIVWKRCRAGVIAKLEVPEEARRSSAFGRKCRFEFVTTLELFGGTEGHSTTDAPEEHRLVYRVGETQRCHKWEEDWRIECGGGIHAYLTREEAEAHQ